MNKQEMREKISELVDIIFELDNELAKLHAALTIFEANWDTGGYHDPMVFWHRCWPWVDKFVPPEHQSLTWAVDYNATHKIEEESTVASSDSPE